MDKFMRLAINEARKNIKSMQGGPFGACIVKKGRAIAVARNTVLKNDASCHAEINAIRLASKKLKSFDLSDCTIYSTTEPCPMCFSAIHWANIGRIVYATKIADARRIGFNELSISAARMKRAGKSKIRLTAGVLRNECLKLMKDWAGNKSKKLY